MSGPFPRPPLRARGAVRRLEVDAPCLVDNPWGDPSRRELIVWTPAGHDEAKLPTILILPGFAGTLDGSLSGDLLDPGLLHRCDALVADGCLPFRVVLPDTMTSLGGSQFLDSPGIGAYQTFLTDVVRPAVDEAFPTTRRWAATGRSSGAYGALRCALADPDHFRAIAWHAGDCAFDLCYLADLPAAIRGLQAAGGVGPFLETFWNQRRISGDGFAALNILAMSCAYSPDPGRSPLPARLPFDPATGEVDFDVLRSWSAHDPLTLIEAPGAATTLAGLDAFFLDAGDRDEYLLHLGLRRLVARLTTLGVPHTHAEFPGGHRGTSWRYDVSLPVLAAALHRDQAQGGSA